MIRHLGIYVGCLVFSYIVIGYLVSSNVSAAVMYCFLAIILASMMFTAIVGFRPKQVLPDLHKRAVFITGCDSGFGHLLAQRLDSLGVAVYAGCLFPEGSGAKELKSMSSDNLHIVELDVRNDSHVQASVEYVRNTLQDRVLFGVVNNAGIASRGELEWHSIDAIQNVMDVNFLGQIRMVKAFLPLLRESKGRIVNVLSIASYSSSPFVIPYCCSKFASRSLTEGLRSELRKFSISVHGIAPNFYATPIITSVDPSAIWDNCPDSVKTAYGEDYNEKALIRMNWIMENFGKPSTRLNAVVDCMVDACIGSSPKDLYVPSLLERIFFKFLHYTPTYILDQMVFLVQPSSTSKPYWNASPPGFNVLWNVFTVRK